MSVLNELSRFLDLALMAAAIIGLSIFLRRRRNEP